MGETVRHKLLAHLGKSTCYLGQPGRWQKGGEYKPVWRVVDNIPRQKLMAEIEAR